MKYNFINKNRGVFYIVAFAIVTFITYLISAKFDIFESFAEWVEQHEKYNFDELVIVVLIWFVALFGIVINKNFTIQRQKKKLSELSSQLQQSIDKKDKLFSILGHDLKSPFNSLIGFSEILLKKIKTADIDKQKELLTIINNTAKRTLNLLTNLLDWARLETNNLILEKEKLDLSVLVNNEINLLESIAHNKSIEIKNTIPEDATIYADENMLGTVVRNLISNAIKYSYPKSIINISLQDHEDVTKITVSDSGVGMTPEQLNGLFYRIGVSTAGTNKENGTGIGLKICKEFIEKNNGKLLVNTAIGAGTDFTVVLPKAESEALTTS